VATARVRFSVTSVRGGYESWQSPSITGLPGSTFRIAASLDELENDARLLAGDEQITSTDKRIWS
jgi:hypothetical protein